MLAKRIIPCLDVDRGRVVKGTRFVALRDAGDPIALASRYDSDGADELVFLDITASAERRRTVIDLAVRVAERLTIPFCVGGGIDGAETAAAVLRAGADKVAMNARRRADGSYEVVIEGGRTPTELDAVDWARRAVDAGAGEILLTSIDR